MDSVSPRCPKINPSGYAGATSEMSAVLFQEILSWLQRDPPSALPKRLEIIELSIICFYNCKSSLYHKSPCKMIVVWGFSGIGSRLSNLFFTVHILKGNNQRSWITAPYIYIYGETKSPWTRRQLTLSPCSDWSPGGYGSWCWYGPQQGGAGPVIITTGMWLPQDTLKALGISKQTLDFYAEIFSMWRKPVELYCQEVVPL